LRLKLRVCPPGRKKNLNKILYSFCPLTAFLCYSFRPSISVHEKGIQTSATPIVVPLPNVNGVKTGQKIERQSRRSTASIDKCTETVQLQNSMDKCTETVQPQNSTDNILNINNDDENNKMSRRYLSHSWRVINPREDVEPNVRPENNSSSFFNYTKKVHPEYFFIHPDWY
jgi:hypothetical protein